MVGCGKDFLFLIDYLPDLDRNYKDIFYLFGQTKSTLNETFNFKRIEFFFFLVLPFSVSSFSVFDSELLKVYTHFVFIDIYGTFKVVKLVYMSGNHPVFPQKLCPK